MNKTLLVALFAATIAVTGCKTTNPESIDASVNEAGAKADSKAAAVKSKKAGIEAKKAEMKAQAATEKQTAKGINKAKDSTVKKITK